MATSADLHSATSDAFQLALDTEAHQATATVLAPTAQAVATQVAPTVQAVATQSSAAVATSIAQSPVQVTSVSSNSQDPTVVLRNAGPTPMPLNGWTLLVGPAFYVGLTGVVVPAGGTMTLHFSAGVDTPIDTYLGLGSGVVTSALDSGTRLVLVAPGNQIASIYTVP